MTTKNEYLDAVWKIQEEINKTSEKLRQLKEKQKVALEIAQEKLGR